MKRQVNIGLFNESFPPVMDGVAVCVQNYAYWLQKNVGKVSVISIRRQHDFHCSVTAASCGQPVDSAAARHGTAGNFDKRELCFFL